MKTADLKADTFYATCDGRCIKPVDPIHSKWAVIKERDPLTGRFFEKIMDEREPDVPPKDAWASCIKKPSKSRHHSGHTGVKVTIHEYDRDGKPYVSDQEIVVHARDIAGLWKDYRVLHIDVIESVFDKRQEESLVREVGDQLISEGMAGKGLRDVFVRHSVHYENGDRIPYAEITVEVRLEDAVGAAKAVRRAVDGFEVVVQKGRDW